MSTSKSDPAAPAKPKQTRRRLPGLSMHERAALLSHRHDDELIDIEDIALLLKTTRAFVYRLHSLNDPRLPPPSPNFGRRLVWHLGSVRKWLREFAMGTTGKARPGPARK